MKRLFLFLSLGIGSNNLARSIPTIVDQTIEDSYATAVSLMKHGDIDEAKEYLITGADAGYLPAQRDLGLILLKEGDVEAAEYYLTLAAEQGCTRARAELKKLHQQTAL